MDFRIPLIRSATAVMRLIQTGLHAPHQSCSNAEIFFGLLAKHSRKRMHARRSPRIRKVYFEDTVYCTFTAFMRKCLMLRGAGRGNRTLVCSLEGCRSTIELYPRKRPPILMVAGQLASSFWASFIRYPQSRITVSAMDGYLFPSLLFSHVPHACEQRSPAG